MQTYSQRCDANYSMFAPATVERNLLGMSSLNAPITQLRDAAIAVRQPIHLQYVRCRRKGLAEPESRDRL